MPTVRAMLCTSRRVESLCEERRPGVCQARERVGWCQVHVEVGPDGRPTQRPPLRVVICPACVAAKLAAGEWTLAMPRRERGWRSEAGRTPAMAWAS
jgi:hypothetical protein